MAGAGLMRVGALGTTDEHIGGSALACRNKCDGEKARKKFSNFHCDPPLVAMERHHWRPELSRGLPN